MINMIECEQKMYSLLNFAVKLRGFCTLSNPY